MSGFRRIDVERVDARGVDRRDHDHVVVEEPLEIRIAGETVAVTMRTPGADRDLVLGFLFTEGLIRGLSEVSAIAPCGRVGDEGRANTIEVTLAPGVRLPVDEHGVIARRGTIVSSACGVCGRRAIDDLVARCAPLPPGEPVSRATIVAAVRALRERQPLFARTGGCHAASLVRAGGEHVATFEDVGRHNAVDKIIGARLRAGALPLEGHVLVVSGRASFEILQKALLAGIPIVAAVSAASSLAVDLARRAGITLAGFVRDGAMTVYAHPERIAPGGAAQGPPGDE